MLLLVILYLITIGLFSADCSSDSTAYLVVSTQLLALTNASLEAELKPLKHR